MPTALPARVHAKLDASVALTRRRATDTDTADMVAVLAPAVEDLFACTPAEAHDALADALVKAASRYGLAREAAALARTLPSRSASPPARPLPAGEERDGE